MELKNIIIALVVVLVIVYFYKNGPSDKKEHMASSSTSISDIDVEALENLASMYQDGVLTATSLKVTGDMEVSGRATAGNYMGKYYALNGYTKYDDVKATDGVFYKETGGQPTIATDDYLYVKGTLNATGNIETPNGMKANYFALKKDASSNHNDAAFGYGAFYRHDGQAYIGTDDKLYVRSSDGKYILINKGNVEVPDGISANYFALKKDASSSHSDSAFHDGAFYRSDGQAYIGVDDIFYVKPKNGTHLKIQDGWTTRGG